MVKRTLHPRRPDPFIPPAIPARKYQVNQLSVDKREFINKWGHERMRAAPTIVNQIKRGQAVAFGLQQIPKNALYLGVANRAMGMDALWCQKYADKWQRAADAEFLRAGATTRGPLDARELERISQAAIKTAKDVIVQGKAWKGMNGSKISQRWRLEDGFSVETLHPDLKRKGPNYKKMSALELDHVGKEEYKSYVKGHVFKSGPNQGQPLFLQKYRNLVKARPTSSFRQSHKLFKARLRMGDGRRVTKKGADGKFGEGEVD